MSFNRVLAFQHADTPERAYTILRNDAIETYGSNAGTIANLEYTKPRHRIADRWSDAVANEVVRQAIISDYGYKFSATCYDCGSFNDKGENMYAFVGQAEF